MTAEQKQRAAELLAAWRATAYALHADRMVALLQELVDAPAPEPVARVTGYYGGYLSIATIDGRVLSAGTALYLAPPAPSVPDGWIRAIDEAMVVHHIGIADRADSYEVAKKKLNALLILNQNIGEYFSAKAPVPSVPDGWQLVPVEVTEDMACALVNASPIDGPAWDDATPEDNAECISIVATIYRAMLAAAPTPAEPPADVARDADRYRWLTQDHPASETRKLVDEIGYCLSVRGYGATSAAIDAAIERDKQKGGEA